MLVGIQLQEIMQHFLYIFMESISRLNGIKSCDWLLEYVIFDKYILCTVCAQ